MRVHTQVCILSTPFQSPLTCMKTMVHFLLLILALSFPLRTEDQTQGFIAPSNILPSEELHPLLPIFLPIVFLPIISSVLFHSFNPSSQSARGTPGALRKSIKTPGSRLRMPSTRISQGTAFSPFPFYTSNNNNNNNNVYSRVCKHTHAAMPPFPCELTPGVLRTEFRISVLATSVFTC